MKNKPSYQHIFFKINNRLEHLFKTDEGMPPVWFTSYNPYDRCINTYQISYDWWGKDLLDLVDNIIDTFKIAKTLRPDPLESFLSRFAGDRILKQSVNSIEAALKAPHTDKTEFLYHLIVLYHHFPRHAKLSIEGVIKNLLLNISQKNKPPIYGTIDLIWDNPNLQYNFYPWIKITLFDHSGQPIQCYEDQEEDWLLIDQESSDAKRTLKCWPSNALPPSNEILEYLENNRLVSNYLDPLFLKYENEEGEFKGKGFYKNIRNENQFEQLKHLLVIPVYDFEMNGRIIGNLTGNCLIPFVGDNNDNGDAKRKQFIEKQLDAIRNKASTIPKDIRNARTEFVISSDIWDVEDPLNDFLCKLPYIQDWECIVLFNRKTKSIASCYSKTKEKDQKNHDSSKDDYFVNYKQRTEACSGGRDACENCDLHLIEPQLKAGLSGIQGVEILSLNKGSGLKPLFYTIDLKSLLNTKILSFIDVIDENLIQRYQDLVICFQFPFYCFFNKNKLEESLIDSATELGDLYLEELIPVFDKILLKLKVGKNARIQESYDLMATQAHDLKSTLNNALIDPTSDAYEMISKGQVEKGLNRLDTALDYMISYRNNISFIINAFRTHFDHTKQNYTVLDDSLILAWKQDRLIDMLNIKGIYPASKIAFAKIGNLMKIKIPKLSLELLMHILVNNGVDAMKSQGVDAGLSRLFRIKFEKIKEKDKQWCRSTVWNKGTQFDGYTLEHAGPRSLSGNLSEGHTGLGFYSIETILKQADARPCEFNRHFNLINAKRPKGALVEFFLPLITDKG